MITFFGMGGPSFGELLNLCQIVGYDNPHSAIRQVFPGNFVDRMGCSMSSLEPVDQLRKLVGLKNEGIIDAAEFARMRSALVNCLTPTADPLDQIRKLALLKNEGIVHADEFDRMKAELLSYVSGNSRTDGRVTENAVADAKSRLASREHDYRQLASQQQSRTKQLRSLKRQISYFAMISRVRAYFDQVALGRAGPIAIAVCVGVLLGVIVWGVFSSSMLFGGLVCGWAAGLFALHVFLIPRDTFVQHRLSMARDQLGSVQTLLARDEPVFQLANLQMETARNEFQAILSQFQSRQNALLSMDWRTLRGIPFEIFLRDVFEELGFKVTETKASGDQGVDLIVERNGSKLAVQAKGYAESVGNSAVQQAHTGMAFYRCNRCAVVTNSTFTAAARDVAQRIGCILIDGSQINSLIHGKINLC